MNAVKQKRRWSRRGRWPWLEASGAALAVPCLLVACAGESGASPEEVLPGQYEYESREGDHWCDVLTDEQLEALGDDLQLDRIRQTTFGQVNHYIGEPSDCIVFYPEPGQEQFQDLLRFEASVQRADWADDIFGSRQEAGLIDVVEDDLAEVPEDGVLVGRLSDDVYNTQVWIDRVCPAALEAGAYEDYAAVQSMNWTFPVEDLSSVFTSEEQEQLLGQLQEYMDDVMPCPDPEPVTIEDIESGTTALDEVDPDLE